MGFDLYGMNPYNPNKAVKPKMDWNKSTTEEERSEHFKKLGELIESGHTQKFQDDYEKERLKAEKHNDKVEKELEKFCKSVEKKLGKTNLAPADFPKEDHDEWERIYHKRKWSASYPFSVENVKAFAEFCRFSGGFKIC